LNYFNEKKEFSSRKKIILTSDVNGKSTAEIDKYCFEVETKHRTHKLSTDSESERDSWVKALNDTISSRKMVE